LNKEKKIGIIGAGKIGEALISGLLKANATTPDRICASDSSPQRCEYISKKYNIKCSPDNLMVAENSSVIILAVKPKDVKPVLEQINKALTNNHLLISVAAGVTINYIQKILGKDIPIIRTMPNTPILVREGMIAISTAENTPKEDLEVAVQIFNFVGKTVVVEEKHLNAITGLSGSGPAYIYLVIEALTEAGVKVGLPRDLAILLAAQTTLGSAKMILETNEHPARLREMVTTPGGVAIDGILELEEGKLRTTLIKAVVKATQRAEELLTN
jgi:pyrroline-5-carboxylate reductase